MTDHQLNVPSEAPPPSATGPEGRAAERIRDQRYQARVAAERGFYRDCENVHDLPEIFHYWSGHHVRPKLEEFGFSDPTGMFRRYLEEHVERGRHGAKRFASIGSGNCDLEIQLASHFYDRGHRDFIIDCLDLNPAMLQRGRTVATSHGIADRMNFVQADLNDWTAMHEYDAVVANQALHHVINLEHLFQQVKGCLKPHGTFIISDMIGRNGHQRWPEALAIVHEFWRKLPPSYRFNNQLQRYEEFFENWDYSAESFEAIRSQDILPLLLDCFHFQLFVAFANVITPFVDRSFGPNFNVTADWDRTFIDQVHQRDDAEIVSGRITPTQMLAIVGTSSDMPMMFQEPMTPEFCVRPPGRSANLPLGTATNERSQDPYDWHTWPHSPQHELEIACRRLKQCEDRVKEWIGQSQHLDHEIEERTAWALLLDKQLEEQTAWAQRLAQELEQRRQWMQQASQDLARTAWARHVPQWLQHLFQNALGIARALRDRVQGRA